MLPELIDLKQCAALLRCTSGQIEELVQAGELPALQIGSSWLFVRADLLIFLAQKARLDASQRRLSPRAKPLVPSRPKAPDVALALEYKNPEPALVLVPAKEAARLMSMGISTFWREVGKNNLPQPVKIGGLTRWRMADLVGFVEAIDREDIRR